jgi:hypothetical protein
MAGDVSKASAKVKGELPGREKQVQKEGEKWASEAGAKVDSIVSTTLHKRFDLVLRSHSPIYSRAMRVLHTGSLFLSIDHSGAKKTNID